jgi:predicted transcriptional regulator
MRKKTNPELSRRERQIMDAIYRRGRATAVEVSEALPNAPGNSAVRAMLGILVRKGFLKIAKDGPRFIYQPTRPRADAGRSAIRGVIETFFAGSLEGAVAALLDSGSGKLTEAEIARLKAVIDLASKGSR